MQIKSEQLASQLEKTLKPVYAIHGDEASAISRPFSADGQSEPRAAAS